MEKNYHLFFVKIKHSQEYTYYPIKVYKWILLHVLTTNILLIFLNWSLDSHCCFDITIGYNADVDFSVIKILICTRHTAWPRGDTAFYQHVNTNHVKKLHH